MAVCTKDPLQVYLYTSLLSSSLRQNAESSINRPSLPATMDRGSWREAKAESWSIHPFICRIPMHPRPPILPPFTDQHQANLHQQRWGAAMQVIRATTVMATNRWGNCCSNKLCSMLSAILSTISFINGMWCHGSDYTPVTSDSHMCLYIRRENKSTSFKHATCWAWGNKQSALFFSSPTISSMTVSVWVEGSVQNHTVLWFFVYYFKCCLNESHTAAWTPINVNYKKCNNFHKSFRTCQWPKFSHSCFFFLFVFFVICGSCASQRCDFLKG